MARETPSPDPTLREERSHWLDRLLRSVSLMWIFVALSAAVLTGGALLLGSILTSSVRDQAIDDAEASLTQYVDGVLAPRLVGNGAVSVHRDAEPVLERELAGRGDIVSVKVWRADGVLAWTNRSRERIGQMFPLEGDLSEVIEKGEAEAGFDELDDLEDRSEHAAAERLGLDHVLEVYAPLRLTAGSAPIGAYEIYADSRAVEHRIADRQRLITLVTGAVFLFLWIALMLLVRGASSTLRRQTRLLRSRSAALAEAYERLEASSLEAIEGLNATVEAKDPYTAGHSRRVQQIALLVADELGITGPELTDIRLGALFHDIGKIAVPDAVLTKPGRLTDEEFEQIKRHSAAGAKIVGKLASLRRHGADHPAPPRALGRPRLPRRPRWRRDPAGGRHHLPRRLLRRHDHRPSLPRGAQRERGDRRAGALPRHPVRARRG